MTALILDLDGVVYLGDELIPGADEALAECERLGHRLLFATNSSLRGPEAAAAKIARITGYPAAAHQVVTSALAAATLAHGLGSARAFVVGADGIIEALLAQGIDIVTDPLDADLVVVGLDLELTYDKVRDASLAIRNGARFIATNVDPSYPMPNGQWPGAGSIVHLIETATGALATSAGKPAQAMIELIETRVPDGEEIWMIGDRPSTDLAMAVAAGWTSVLVLTGVTASGDEVPDEWRPDVVLESIAGLPNELKRAIR